ncbi:MAG: class B sortase [Coprococcus sp.]
MMDYDDKDNVLREYDNKYGLSEDSIDDAVKLAQKILQDNKTEKQTVPLPAKSHYITVGQKNKRGWRALLAGLVMALVISVAFIFYYIISHKNNSESISEMRENVKHDYEYSEDALISGGAEEKITIPVDFKALTDINPDIYAWIYVPGTDVDYPVLQNENDGYYLTHDSEGEYSVDGAIYTETANSKEFDDFNTVIYGHNMKNGSMFSSLHNYEDPDFFDDNRYVYIYTPDAILVYKIYAAYRYDNRHILDSYDFDDDKIKKSYIDYVFNMRNLYATVKNDETVNVDSHILTLSTCCGDEDARWLVQAVQIEIKTP